MKDRYRFFDPDEMHLSVKLERACHFLDHQATLAEDRSFRYADTHACVHCITALTKPGLRIDVNRIRPDRVRHFLRFWSMVSIGAPDACWPWFNPHDKKQKCVRLPIPHSGKYEWVSPSRAALWFSWGDTGLLPYHRTCNTPGCCNPLHIRVDQVPHFLYHRAIDLINLREDMNRLNGHREMFTRSLIETNAQGLEAIRRANPDWVARISRTVLADESNESGT